MDPSKKEEIHVYKYYHQTLTYILLIFPQSAPLFLFFKKEGAFYNRPTCNHGVAVCFVNSYSGRHPPHQVPRFLKLATIL
jgi:hypothetical protein